MTSAIQLRGLRAVGTHGVLPEEQARAQPFEIDLDVEADLRAAGQSDALTDTVDYGALAEAAARVVSLLASPHNLHAYDELGLASAHYPLSPQADVREVLPGLYTDLRAWIGAGERVLLHMEELGDRLMGVVAGYLLWADMLQSGPQAITALEQLVHRQMGPSGRELVAAAAEL